jgi:RND family efflux transporter MFP subunit
MKKINIPQMRTLATFAAAIAIMSACSPAPEGGIDALVAKRDSLKTLRNDIETSLAEVESLIAELDTTAKPALVTTYQPKTEDFKHFFEVYGNVQTDKVAALYPESQGLIKKINVSEGQLVSKGQIIVQLDTELVRRNINELKTSLELATTLFEKQKRLWDQNVGSEVQYLEAKNRKEGLENSIATLEEQANRGTVRAPFAGVVDKIFPKIGEMASPQMAIARVVNTDNIYIPADVSERYLGKIKAGDAVSVVVNKNDTLFSTISRVGTFINPNNRTFEARVELKESPKNLLPNSLVVLKINDFTAAGAVAIPSSLIMQDGEGSDYIFIAEKNGKGYTARKQPIKSGMRYEGRTLVISGLENNSQVIDRGSRSVRDGDLVEITEM